MANAGPVGDTLCNKWIALRLLPINLGVTNDLFDRTWMSVVPTGDPVIPWIPEVPEMCESIWRCVVVPMLLSVV